MDTTFSQDILRISKFLQSRKLLHPSPAPESTSQRQSSLKFPKLSVSKQCCSVSRRDLTIGSNSMLLLLVGSQALDPFYTPKANAEESSQEIEEDLQRKGSPEDGPRCTGKDPTKRVFLDISIDREPAGRIIIGLYGDDTPAGVTRFINLVSGAAGITYRRKEFVKITPNYIQHGGIRSYGVDVDLAKRTGNSLASDTLLDEWQRVNKKCSGPKNLAGSVSIVVRDPLKPPPKLKLVARGGKLEVDEEEVGTNPNGTEFIISMKDSPELDDSTLVIGRVLEGMQVVDIIGQVNTVKDNTTSPYFRVAKLIGDKRAVVAERGFNRPYSKVIVTNCGLLEQ